MSLNKHIYIKKILLKIYCTLCLGLSIFYLIAFFWKGITKLCGGIWLITVLLLMLTYYLRKKTNSRILKTIAIGCLVLISLIQLFAAYYWVLLSDGRHTFLIGTSAYQIKPVGAILHLIVFLAGIDILYIDFYKNSWESKMNF